MSQREQAILLLAKAEEDLSALHVLSSRSEVSDTIWGFHAQQAVEKLLKAMLAHYGIAFPFSHRLYELADLLEDHDRPLDEEYEVLMPLTRYAVELRYSLLDADSSLRLDQTLILRQVARLREEVAVLLRR